MKVKLCLRLAVLVSMLLLLTSTRAAHPSVACDQSTYSYCATTANNTYQSCIAQGFTPEQCAARRDFVYCQCLAKRACNVAC
jgi:hypothetical protein